MENSAAILLRRTKLTETSLILTWLSEEHGKIRTVAKGAREAKSRFTGRLDLFFECEIQFSRSRRSELHSLREVALRTAHEGLRADYHLVTLASYFVELIELVTEPEHPVPEIFNLLQRALRHINVRPPSLRVLEHFEAELARSLGIQEPSVSPAESIRRAYHHLPRARREIVTAMQESGQK
ncbi:MAG: DNA repair protein RecO [Opitutaceae bacterium]